jgi:osmotically inducible lipoprotein OsmB
MRFKSIAIVAVGCLALAACGTNPTDRAVSGAALGAGAGLAIGAVAGAPLLGAAIIGGAAGAVTGAVTDPNKINLGRPVWEN